MKLLVTGAAGQLGSAMVREFDSHSDVVASTRRELDLTDHPAVMKTVADVRPDVVINCAACNKVDDAEDAPVDTLATNSFAVQSLARACREHDVLLVHYGTDFVFDGTASRPYVEEDRPNPGSVYAVSKLLGEWFATDTPRHYILRVESLFGGSVARSSVDRIIDAIRAEREMRVFADRVTSPSYVADVAAATRALIERGAPFGLYHCVNTGFATWHELAREAELCLVRSARLVPISVADVKLRAARPQFAALSNEKLAAAGVVMPSWRDAIRRYLEVGRS